MAGDWLKVCKDTPDKPEILAIAARLNCHPDIAFARLFKLWSWFDSHTTDGVTYSVTKVTLDALLHRDGLCDALVTVGWLIERADGGLQLPNFGYHNGETAKARAMSAKRQERHRSNRDKSNAGSNADTVTKVTPDALPREEKRREENKKKKQDSSTFVPPLWIDQQLWDDFIDMRKKIKKPATDRAKQLLINELQKLIEQGYSQQDVIGNSIRNGWQDFYAPKRGMNGNNGGFVC